MIGSNNEVAIDQYVLSLIEACQLKQEHRPYSNTFVRAYEYAFLSSEPLNPRVTDIIISQPTVLRWNPQSLRATQVLEVLDWFNQQLSQRLILLAFTYISNLTILI